VPEAAKVAIVLALMAAPLLLTAVERVLHWWKRRTRRSRRPDEYAGEYYDVAYLRGGALHVVVTALVRLAETGAVRLTLDESTSNRPRLHYSVDQSRARAVGDPIEKNLLKSLDGLRQIQSENPEALAQASIQEIGVGWPGDTMAYAVPMPLAVAVAAAAANSGAAIAEIEQRLERQRLAIGAPTVDKRIHRRKRFRQLLILASYLGMIWAISANDVVTAVDRAFPSGIPSRMAGVPVHGLLMLAAVTVAWYFAQRAVILACRVIAPWPLVPCRRTSAGDYFLRNVRPADSSSVVERFALAGTDIQSTRLTTWISAPAEPVSLRQWRRDQMKDLDQQSRLRLPGIGKAFGLPSSRVD
jgi:hypothetical protein